MDKEGEGPEGVILLEKRKKKNKKKEEGKKRQRDRILPFLTSNRMMRIMHFIIQIQSRHHQLLDPIFLLFSLFFLVILFPLSFPLNLPTNQPRNLLSQINQNIRRLTNHQSFSISLFSFSSLSSFTGKTNSQPGRTKHGRIPRFRFQCVRIHTDALDGCVAIFMSRGRGRGICNVCVGNFLGFEG